MMLNEDTAPPVLHPNAVIRYDETWQVSICTKCKIGVHGDTMKRHLTGKHHCYCKPDWSPILDALNGKPQPRSKDEFPRPRNGIAPIPDLKVWDGFACNLCSYLITSRDAMHSKHWKTHKDVVCRTEIFYRPVKVQVPNYLFGFTCYFFRS